jgi:hypothetical protein
MSPLWRFQEAVTICGIPELATHLRQAPSNAMIKSVGRSGQSWAEDAFGECGRLGAGGGRWGSPLRRTS